MLNLPPVQSKLSSAFFWFIKTPLVVELISKTGDFSLAFDIYMKEKCFHTELSSEPSLFGFPLVFLNADFTSSNLIHSSEKPASQRMGVCAIY